ncbi:MAG TPA: hypothetical protein VK592_04470, partial [Candidatus Dormibacteraeota bacterium]|nr:hypothetical protein [Candidatus Dormibacteraeota bacterium]
MPPRTRRTPPDGPSASPAEAGVPPPTDAALEALAADLAATGARSRRARRTAATPAVAYSAALRQRLLMEPGAPEAVEGALALAPLPPVVEPLSDAMLAGGVVEPAAVAAEGLAAEAPALRLERRRYRRPDPSPGTVSPWSDERAALPVEVAPPTRRPRWRPRRLVALAVAVIVVAAAALGASRFLMPGTVLQAVAGDVAGVVLTRGGQSSALQAGTILLEGDTITVSPTGSAAFSVGGSIARLAGGAVVHLDAIDAQGITIAELAGRVYNRVDPADGVPYRVVTGPLTWTASGTAFDVDRIPVLAGEGAGGERVTVIAVEHDVALAGPGLEANVAQGQQAVVVLGGSGPIQPRIMAADEQAWQDPWLVENGSLDQVLGFPLGSLTAELATESPSSSAEVTPSEEPTVSASPSGEPSASPSAAATPTVAPATPPQGGPSPSPSPSPTPKPTPGLATLDLTLRACPGGVVIDWGTYTGSGFHH